MTITDLRNFAGRAAALALALLAAPTGASEAADPVPRQSPLPTLGQDQMQTAQLRRLLGKRGGKRGNDVAQSVAGLERRTIAIDGRDRTYYYYVPRNLDRSRPAPMVVGFHGGGGNALAFGKRVGLREMAEKYGFVVVAPEGVSQRSGGGGSWNADSIRRQGYAEVERVDDIGFVAALMDQMQRELRIDPGRIYAMGLSKGGMMAYRLACAMPERLSAIAVVAGTLSTAACATGGDVSVLQIHGTNDQNVPFEGGRGRMSARGADWPGVARGLDLFRRSNACSVKEAPQQVARDTSCQIASCAGGDEVNLCTVEGGGHAWPGAKPAGWQRANDVYVSPYFDATSYISEFFLRN